MFGIKGKNNPSLSPATASPNTTGSSNTSSPMNSTPLSGSVHPLSPGVGNTIGTQVTTSPLHGHTSTSSSSTSSASNLGGAASSDYNSSSSGSNTGGISGGITMLSGMPINPNGDGGPVLIKFIRFLLGKGTSLEHIFKPHPELDSEVQIVKKNLLKDMSMSDIEQLQLSSFTNNPHVVAELLKQYLFALPEPLFSFQLYDSFLLTHTIMSHQDRLWSYRFLLAYLPPGFRGAIKNVLALLNKVHSNHGQTKMDSNALASVFASAFLRPEEDMYYMKSDRVAIEEIVKLWIEEIELISKPPTTLGQAGGNSIVAAASSSSSTTPTSSFIQTQPSGVSGQNSSSFLNNNNNSNSSNNNIKVDGNKDDQILHPLAHPTIGLNKVGQTAQQLTNATNPQQSPKLSLPTIPKQQNTQQTTTLIKVKPPLQASSTGSKSTPPSQPLNSSPLVTSSNTTAPTATASPSNNTTTTPIPTVTLPSQLNLSPSKPTTNTTNNNTNNNVPTISTTPSTPSKSPRGSTGGLSASTGLLSPPPKPPQTLTLVSTLDSETLEKLNRIRSTTESLINDFIWQQLKTVVRNIEKEMNYTTTIRLSTVLRDSKRHLVDSTLQLLQLAKVDVKQYIKENPKPVTLTLTILSTDFMNGTISVGPNGEDPKHLDLKRASHLAVEEICEYIYFLKTKLYTFTYKEYIVITAQIFSKLKAIIEQNGTGGGNPSLSGSIGSPTTFLGLSSGGIPPPAFNNNNTNSNSPDHSPSSSPSINRRSIGLSSNNSGTSIGGDDKSSNLRIFEVCSQEIDEKLKAMRRDLETASLGAAVEIGKAIRSTKQTLTDLYTENGYNIPVDVKVNTLPTDDQLSILKKTLQLLLDRIVSQITDVCNIVKNNQSNPSNDRELKNIIDKLLFINKVLNF